MKHILKLSEFLINESEDLKGPESGPSQEVVDFLNRNLSINPHKGDKRMRGPGLLANEWKWNPKTQMVDVEGIVYIRTEDRIPPDLRFGVVTDSFTMMSCNPKNGELQTIEFTPRRVGRNLAIIGSHLKTLKGCTPVVEGIFDCSSNDLTSLEGSPQIVKGTFQSTYNNLSTLKGISPNINSLRIINIGKGNNQGLQTLKDGPSNLTGPASVDGIRIGTGMWGKKEGWVQAFKKLIGLEEIPYTEIAEWFMDSPGGYGDFGYGDFDFDDPPEDATVGRSIAKIIPNRRKKVDLIIEMIPSEYKEILDSHMKETPLDIDLLDEFPDLKAGVLQRTGLKDMSALARSMRKGMI